MSKIYKNQSSLQIELTTGVNVTSATCKIKYIKPTGVTGEWAATIVTAITGVIKYDLTGTELSETGMWKIWAFVTFSDSRIAPGEVVFMNVYNEGE